MPRRHSQGEPGVVERVSGRGVALYLEERPLDCPMCGSAEFRAGLSPGGKIGRLPLFGGERGNRNPASYVCLRCAYVLWFDRG